MVFHKKIKQPLVTVLMPVRNSASFLPQALESILRQTYRNIELIIINDSSTDQSPQIINRISKASLIVINNTTRLGIAVSLNRGLERAKGKYIARMDADDIAYPNRIATQLKFLIDHPRVGFVGSYAELINETDHVIGVKKISGDSDKIRSQLAFTNVLIHPTVMFRSGLCKGLGGYDEKMEGAEDYDLWLRFLQISDPAVIPQVLLKYRLQRKGVSYDEIYRINRAYAKVQLKKIREYGYPKWQIIFALKAFFSSLTPLAFKQFIYEKAFRY